MFTPEIIDSIRRSVCAVIITSIDLFEGQKRFAAGEKQIAFTRQVVGTAFVVGPRIVVTNRHVLNPWIKKEQPNTHCSVEFYHSIRGEEQARLWHSTRTQLLMIGDKNNDPAGFGADIGFLKITADDNFLTNHPPVNFPPPDRRIDVGEPIAVCGYPWGNDFLDAFEDPDMKRHGPLVTFGHIAGLAPNDLGPIGRTTFYVADITAAPGMSGSPVFLRDGTVIGILFGGRISIIKDRQDQLHGLPLGFGYILPIHDRLLTWGIQKAVELPDLP